MLTPFEIPLSNQAQKFAIDLAGATYNLLILWNAASACWVLDIADANFAAVVQGVPLVAGANLLAQYRYLGIGGGLVCYTDTDLNAPPTFDNLGTAGHLQFILET